ncbi:helix-turn-helix transcriptional regulator [Streptococcus macedonicus]|uniref:helix-turn-helix transcriptional regulator n=1 Tax=Streptococcus macedonicus TaxID=59310 RepID=UPI00211E9169|nr:helix-turn-helix transcriptional regulator [Streptococcus macedonicus]
MERDREQLGIFPEYLAELEKDDMERIAQEESELQADLDLINSLDNELQRRVLIERYSHGHNWDKVADTLGYSRKYLCKVHKQALDQLAKQTAFLLG